MRQSTRLLEVFGVVQTVRITVEVPHLFLDMAVDRCRRWSRQCRKLWSLRSSRCPFLSLFTAVSAAAMVSQMTWITYISGDGDLAASSFSVAWSWGVWRKVSSPEVLRLFFCERRMRCVFVWCSSYSSQWTVRFHSRHGVVELIIAMVSSWVFFLGPCTQVHGRADPRH